MWAKFHTRTLSEEQLKQREKELVLALKTQKSPEQISYQQETAWILFDVWVSNSMASSMIEKYNKSKYSDLKPITERSFTLRYDYTKVDRKVLNRAYLLLKTETTVKDSTGFSWIYTRPEKELVLALSQYFYKETYYWAFCVFQQIKEHGLVHMFEHRPEEIYIRTKEHKIEISC